MRTASRIALCIWLLHVLAAGLAAADVRYEIGFPDILGYKTLKCDLHLHTVFSDGSVWPTVRVDEAWREGLDVISLTDHIEYQPHKKDIPTNNGRSHEIAGGLAKQKDIVLIKGAEITRDTPPGHFNALFLSDITTLDTNDFNDVFRAAAKQAAFVFWNHPLWKPDVSKEWLPVHTMLYENKWLHGIEIANGDDYYAQVHRWAIDRGLTIIGNSDIHSPILHTRTTSAEHRTLTLVFATDKTTEAIKEALIKGRTAVWCKDQLFGAKEYLEAIFNTGIKVSKSHYRQDNTVLFTVKSTLGLDVRMQPGGRRGSTSATPTVIPAGASVVLRATLPSKEAETPDEITPSYRIRNFVTAPNEPLVVTLTVPLK